MFKAFKVNFLRTISASFCGAISALFNLVCIYHWISPFTLSVKLSATGLLVLIQAIMFAFFFASNQKVSNSGDIPFCETDKFLSAILAGYSIGFVMPWVMFLREL